MFTNGNFPILWVFACLILPSWALPQGSNVYFSTVTVRPGLAASTIPSIIPTATTSSSSVGPTAFQKRTQFQHLINSTIIGRSADTQSHNSTLSFNTSHAVPTQAGFLRGVNIGGWLVLEKWMNEDVFIGAASGAKDQYSFDSTPGAADALDQHWSTWFTEADIQIIKSYGLNALRIPIGFWSYDNSETPYLKGADAYLEKAIGWSKSAGLKVWIDLHGVPGSQNGFQNSGRTGKVHWQEGSNIEQTLNVLKTMAFKYGALEYADTVVGLELVNEPRLKDGLTFETVKKFAKDGYHTVKAAAANPNLMVVMHDAFNGPDKWTGIATELGPKGAYGIDTHRYQAFREQDKALAQPEHIAKACSLAADLRAANAIAPTFVGEWSGATDICVFADGRTMPGTSCDGVKDCQCQSDPLAQWGPAMVEQVRRYVEAQLDTFETSTSGYYFWSWRGPGAWGFKEGVEKGVIPNPVTERRFEGQCG